MDSVHQLKRQAVQERNCDQMGEFHPPAENKMFQLGDRHYFAVVNRFDCRSLVHIRKFYEQNTTAGHIDPQKIPTKFGIALTVEEWFELVRITPLLNDIIRLSKRMDYSPMYR